MCEPQTQTKLGNCYLSSIVVCGHLAAEDLRGRAAESFGTDAASPPRLFSQLVEEAIKVQ